jgi:hypothetical protein
VKNLPPGFFRGDGEGGAAGGAFIPGNIAQLSKEYDETMAKLRETEGRVFSLEKLLERKDDELKFYRLNDNSKTSQLKEELFNVQQQAQEREAELLRELTRTKGQLEKAQHQLDLWVVEMHEKEPKLNELDLKNMDPDDFRELYAKSEGARRKLESQLKLVQEDLAAQEFIKEKEIQVVKAQKEEEFNKRLHKLRSEQRQDIERVKLEHSLKLQQVQAEYETKLDEQVKKFDEVFADKDSKKMLEYVFFSAL